MEDAYYYYYYGRKGSLGVPRIIKVLCALFSSGNESNREVKSYFAAGKRREVFFFRACERVLFAPREEREREKETRGDGDDARFLVVKERHRGRFM